MTELTMGSICTGYGGLDMAICRVFNATVKWVSDISSGACRLAAHRWPDVPNLGNITAVNWHSVPTVDIIGGGTPCQDVSMAGSRKGMFEGTRSNLWQEMREAVNVIRPKYVIWENVPGSRSAAAFSGVGSGDGQVDNGAAGPVLRALGRVLGDLAALGYDAEWRSVRASDVGACHRRERVFVLAWDTHS